MIYRDRSHARQQIGLTLVEVLVALGIIAITMVMFGYFSTSLRATSDSRRETAAANFSRSYLDALRSQWQDLSMYTSGAKGLIAELQRPNPPFLEVPEGFASYTVDIERRNVRGEALGTHSASANSAGNATGFDWEDENQNDFLRFVILTLTDAQGETYEYSTQIVRPTTDQVP